MDLSIIVPIYNGEKYLHKCLQSLINQKGKHYKYEVICINDGSTDSSLEILISYKKKYSSLIKVINIDNNGVSNARNVGIDNSIGDYITFVDSDDWVKSSFVKLLMDEVDSETFLICSSIYAYDNKLIENIEAIDKTVFNTENSVWSKVFYRKRIIQYNIRFPKNITMGEDLVFTFCYACCVNKYKYMNKYLYYYRGDSVGSLMNSKIKTTYKQVFKACEYVYGFAKENDLLNENFDNIEYLFIKNLIVRNTLKIIKFERGIINKIVEINNSVLFVRGYFPDWIDNKLILHDADGYISKKLGKYYLNVLRNLDNNLVISLLFLIKGKCELYLKI